MRTVDIEDLERLTTFTSSGTRRKGPSREAVLSLWGGYEGPHWRIDRRPRPLRDRRTMQRYITSLRRWAVLKLWGPGLSFRQIGWRLGISHVAA